MARRLLLGFRLVLTLGNIELRQASTLKLLGSQVNKNETATTWVRHLFITWKKNIHFIRRTTSKSWGGVKSTVRLLVRFFMQSKTPCGYKYINLTRIQKNEIKVLSRDNLRNNAGLPISTAAQYFYSQSELNTISDLAKGLQAAQELYLRGTAPGRQLSTELGFHISYLPSLPPTTPQL